MILHNRDAARARGNAFDEIRGSWLDRLLGHARSCAALDDPWGVAAYALEIEACTRGDTIAGWVDALADASARGWPLRAAGLEVCGQFERIAIGAARLASERRPAEAAEARAEVAASIAMLLERDTEIDLTRPRYRWRVPWTGDGLAAFHALLAPLFAQVPEVHPIVPVAAPALARAEAAAAAWRERLTRRPEPADYRDPGDARDAPAIAAELAACRASLHGQADALLARDRAWPEPLRAAHAAALRTAADAATSVIDIDLASSHHAACFEIEAAWLRALVATVGAPLRAALIAGYEPSADAVASVAAARAHAAALAGQADPFRLPWFDALVSTSIEPLREVSLDGFGSYLGEGGIELLGPYRTWAAVTGGRDPRGLTAVTATPDAAGPPTRRHIALWDREVPLEDATALRLAPARPALGT